MRREGLIKERYECGRNKPDPLHELNADQPVLTSMHILLSTSKRSRQCALLQNSSRSYLLWFEHNRAAVELV